MRTRPWKFTLRVIGILSLIVAVIWLVVDLGYKPILVFLSGVAELLISFFICDDAEDRRLIDPRLTQRNRQAMLDRVRHAWIEGVLERSPSQEARMALGLGERPDAVKRPSALVVQQQGRPPRSRPRGAHLIGAFDQLDGALLILGDSGTSKTTLLLELPATCSTGRNRTRGIPSPSSSTSPSGLSRRKLWPTGWSTRGCEILGIRLRPEGAVAVEPLTRG